VSIAGPVDAAYKAIDALVRVEVNLDDYAMNAVTEGIEALAVTRVTIRPTGPLASQGIVKSAQVGSLFSQSRCIPFVLCCLFVGIHPKRPLVFQGIVKSAQARGFRKDLDQVLVPGRWMHSGLPSCASSSALASADQAFTEPACSVFAVIPGAGPELPAHLLGHCIVRGRGGGLRPRLRDRPQQAHQLHQVAAGAQTGG